jgi:hypothetical protein
VTEPLSGRSRAAHRVAAIVANEPLVAIYPDGAKSVFPLESLVLGDFGRGFDKLPMSKLLTVLTVRVHSEAVHVLVRESSP